MNFSRYTPLIKISVLAVAIGAIQAGCGEVDLSEQLAKDRLEHARAAYAQAKANPIVESYSLKSLLEAEKTLQEAEQIRERIYSPGAGDFKAADPGMRRLFFDDISRLAYIAERKSQLSEALAEGVLTRNEIVSLSKEKLELEHKMLKQDLNKMTSSLEQARQKLKVVTSEAERIKLLAEIKAHEAALAKAELAQLTQELSELQGQLTDRGIVLTIGDVLFATAKSNLNSSAQRSMDKLADFLKKKQNRNLLVEGHTDSVGSNEYNRELSEHRAQSVKNALIQRGVAPERIVTIGYGEKFPLASNATPAGRQQNRRVEVIILNEGVSPKSQFRK